MAIYIYIYGSRPLTAWKYRSDYMSCLALVKKDFLAKNIFKNQNYIPVILYVLWYSICW